MAGLLAGAAASFGIKTIFNELDKNEYAAKTLIEKNQKKNSAFDAMTSNSKFKYGEIHAYIPGELSYLSENTLDKTALDFMDSIKKPDDYASTDVHNKWKRAFLNNYLQYKRLDLIGQTYLAGGDVKNSDIYSSQAKALYDKYVKNSMYANDFKTQTDMNNFLLAKGQAIAGAIIPDESADLGGVPGGLTAQNKAAAIKNNAVVINLGDLKGSIDQAMQTQEELNSNLRDNTKALKQDTEFIYFNMQRSKYDTRNRNTSNYGLLGRKTITGESVESDRLSNASFMKQNTPQTAGDSTENNNGGNSGGKIKFDPLEIRIINNETGEVSSFFKEVAGGDFYAPKSDIYNNFKLNNGLNKFNFKVK